MCTAAMFDHASPSSLLRPTTRLNAPSATSHSLSFMAAQPSANQHWSNRLFTASARW